MEPAVLVNCRLSGSKVRVRVMKILAVGTRIRQPMYLCFSVDKRLYKAIALCHLREEKIGVPRL